MDQKLKRAIYAQLSVYKSEASPKVLKEFLTIVPKDLSLCHFGLGLYIRNNYLTPESDLQKLFVADGVQCKDDMSSVIIRMWHRRLKRETSNKRHSRE